MSHAPSPSAAPGPAPGAFPECPPDRALFRAAADRPSASAALPSPLRKLWPQIVEAILAPAAPGAPAASLAALAERLRQMGTRPQDYLALHGAFEGVLARMGGAHDRRRAAWEAVIDAGLAAMMSEAYGLRRATPALVAA